MDHVIRIRIRNDEVISDMGRGKEHHVIGPNFDGVVEVNDVGMLIRDDENEDMVPDNFMDYHGFMDQEERENDDHKDVIWNNEKTMAKKKEIIIIVVMVVMEVKIMMIVFIK
ncbi:unnamed protein product [Lactuca virosa]|uniref:Uncharacterized protein n=1 Tax=Lactuca virosa TaxID=75947 RepID=A0AAU9MAU9_9ASTR|nr:unnamed protein product [Lactuca virosa]